MTVVAVQDRPYQVEARDRVFEKWRWQDEGTLLILPTGTGKTVVAGMIARMGLDEYGLKTLFLAHREELILQAIDKLSRFDLTCAMEMADSNARRGAGLLADLVVGTVQTMQGRRLESWPRREFGIIIIDEAHHARAVSYRRILDWFQGYNLLGITATPDRGDRKNLGAIFGSVASEYTLAQAIEDGYLVPISTARLKTGVDLKEMGTSSRDFTDDEIALLISPHIEELADAFSRECEDRPSVLFTPNVRTAEGMADALTYCGVRAEVVSGKMGRSSRRDTLGRFSRAEFQAVVCCDLLIEGWDEPQVACVGICRPTKIRSRYAQMVGRGTRPHPESGKTDLLVIDFAWETTESHKLITATDLFDDSAGEVDPEVKAEATRLISGERVDPRDALRQAEKIVRERRKFKVFLTGRQASYEKTVFDPVGVGSLLGVPIRAGWDFDPRNPATDNQLAALERAGVVGVENLGRGGAGKLLDVLRDRRERGMSTLNQINYLADLGVPDRVSRDMTMEEASGAIDELKRARRK